MKPGVEFEDLRKRVGVGVKPNTRGGSPKNKVISHHQSKRHHSKFSFDNKLLIEINKAKNNDKDNVLAPVLNQIKRDNRSSITKTAKN